MTVVTGDEWSSTKKIGTVDRRIDRQTDRQTDGNGRPISSYSRGDERSRKRKSRESADGLYYNTSVAYAWEVILHILSDSSLSQLLKKSKYSSVVLNFIRKIFSN